MKFFDFCALVSSPSDLVVYLQEKGVLSAAKNCEKCLVPMSLQSSNRMADGVCYRCTRCKATRSIRQNSFLKNSKLPLNVFAAIFFFHHMEILQKHVAELLNISQQTLVDWSNFIRERCSLMLVNAEKLGGPGMRVQVDESVLSAPKLTRNQHARPVVEKWVFGAYDTTKKVGWIQRVPDRSGETLVAAIKDSCLPGTIIVSDGWPGYSRVSEHGYFHEVVVHERHFVDPATGIHTNNVENYWQRCKRRFKRMYGTSNELLPSHIDEFMWIERYGKTLVDRWNNWFRSFTPEYSN